MPGGHYREVCETHIVTVRQCRCPAPDKDERMVPCPGLGLCRGVPTPDPALCAVCGEPIRYVDLIGGHSHIGPFLHPTLPMHTPTPEAP